MDRRDGADAGPVVDRQRGGGESFVRSLLGVAFRQATYAQRRNGSRFGRRYLFARGVDRGGGARVAGDALLVHPLRESADVTADRTDARRAVPDRERQNRRSSHEL